MKNMRGMWLLKKLLLVAMTFMPLHAAIGVLAPQPWQQNQGFSQQRSGGQNFDWQDRGRFQGGQDFKPGGNFSGGQWPQQQGQYVGGQQGQNAGSNSQGGFGGGQWSPQQGQGVGDNNPRGPRGFGQGQFGDQQGGFGGGQERGRFGQGFTVNWQQNNVEREYQQKMNMLKQASMNKGMAALQLLGQLKTAATDVLATQGQTSANELQVLVYAYLMTDRFFDGVKLSKQLDEDMNMLDKKYQEDYALLKAINIEGLANNALRKSVDGLYTIASGLDLVIFKQAVKQLTDADVKVAQQLYDNGTKVITDKMLNDMQANMAVALAKRIKRILSELPGFSPDNLKKVSDIADGMIAKAGSVLSNQGANEAQLKMTLRSLMRDRRTLLGMYASFAPKGAPAVPVSAVVAPTTNVAKAVTDLTQGTIVAFYSMNKAKYLGIDGDKFLKPMFTEDNVALAKSAQFKVVRDGDIIAFERTDGVNTNKLQGNMDDGIARFETANLDDFAKFAVEFDGDTAYVKNRIIGGYLSCRDAAQGERVYMRDARKQPTAKTDLEKFKIRIIQAAPVALVGAAKTLNDLTDGAIVAFYSMKNNKFFAVDGDKYLKPMLSEDVVAIAKSAQFKVTRSGDMVAFERTDGVNSNKLQCNPDDGVARFETANLDDFAKFSLEFDGESIYIKNPIVGGYLSCRDATQAERVYARDANKQPITTKTDAEKIKIKVITPGLPPVAPVLAAPVTMLAVSAPTPVMAAVGVDLTGQVVQVGSNLSGKYQTWNDQYKFAANTGKSELLFTSTMQNDLHVALSPVKGSNDPMYEIVLGGWGNSKSAIRRKSQGQNLVEKGVGVTNGMVVAVTLDRDAKRIVVEKVESSGARTLLIDYVDANLIPNIQYFAFSGWNTPGTITSMKVTEGAAVGSSSVAPAAATVVAQGTPASSFTLVRSVNDVPAGTIVALYSAQKSKYAVIEGDKYLKPMIDEGALSSIKAAQFKVVREGDFVGFERVDGVNANRLQSDNDTGVMRFENANFGDWEKWTLEFDGDVVRLKNKQTNGYASARDAAQQERLWTKDASKAPCAKGDWERFYMRIVSAAPTGPAAVNLAGDSIMIGANAQGKYASWGEKYKFNGTSGKSTIQFTSTVANDLYVGFSPIPGVSDPMYEVILGGWNNAKCAIRRKQQGANVAEKAGGVASGMTFAITIDRDAKRIYVEKIEGANRTILVEYIDPSVITNAQYFSFSSYALPGALFNLSVTEGPSDKPVVAPAVFAKSVADLKDGALVALFSIERNKYVGIDGDKFLKPMFDEATVNVVKSGQFRIVNSGGFIGFERFDGVNKNRLQSDNDTGIARFENANFGAWEQWTPIFEGDTVWFKNQQTGGFLSARDGGQQERLYSKDGGKNPCGRATWERFKVKLIGDAGAQPINAIDAWYGVDGGVNMRVCTEGPNKGMAVKDIINQKMIVNNVLKSDGNLNALFGDAAPGVPKVLAINMQTSINPLPGVFSAMAVPVSAHLRLKEGQQVSWVWGQPLP